MHSTFYFQKPLLDMCPSALNYEYKVLIKKKYHSFKKMGGPQKEKNLEILTNEQRLGIFAWTLKHQRTIRVHNEGFSALEGVPKTALK